MAERLAEVMDDDEEEVTWGGQFAKYVLRISCFLT